MLWCVVCTVLNINASCTRIHVHEKPCSQMSRSKQDYTVAIGTRSTMHIARRPCTVHHALYWAFGHHMIGVQAKYTSQNRRFTNQEKLKKVPNTHNIASRVVYAQNDCVVLTNQSASGCVKSNWSLLCSKVINTHIYELAVRSSGLRRAPSSWRRIGRYFFLFNNCKSRTTAVYSNTHTCL